MNRGFEGRSLPELDVVYKDVMKRLEGVWEKMGTE